jgi:hypothetical protein
VLVGVCVAVHGDAVSVEMATHVDPLRRSKMTDPAGVPETVAVSVTAVPEFTVDAETVRVVLVAIAPGAMIDTSGGGWSGIGCHREPSHHFSALSK